MDSVDSQLVESVLHMESQLKDALAELNSLIHAARAAAVPKEVVLDSEEEKLVVARFLVNLQDSGIVNMLNADDYIQKRFGFSKAKAEAYLFDYIDNYKSYKEKASPEGSVKAVEVPKKRKGPKPYSEMTPDELAIAKAKKAASVASSQSSTVDNAVPDVSVLSSVKPRRQIKLKSPDVVSSKGVLIWNSFLNMVRSEMEVGGITVNYEDVVKKAREMKGADKEAYKLFSETWTPETN